MRVLSFLVLIATLIASPAESALVPQIQSGPDLAGKSIHPRLRGTVDFWKRVYSRYTNLQGIIHDSKHLNVIYEVIELTDLQGRARENAISRSKAHWKNVLNDLAKNPNTNTPDARHVRELFQNIKDKDKYSLASRSGRMRFQLGQRDRFRKALIESGRYLSRMEEIFRSWGLPTDLTRIPFLESGFNSGAVSKVGAKGIWQFIESTGKQFLRIDRAVDGRIDPILATEAAAKFLRKNFHELGSWPLAIMAYNFGRTGILRATEALKTKDPVTIIENYQNPSFKFASRNFYPSVVAAIEVERETRIHFGDIKKKAPLEYVEVGIADYISLPVLTHHLAIQVNEFKTLNPSFGRSVLVGKMLIPALYRVKLPLGWGEKDGGPREAFWKRYLKIPKSLKHRRQVRSNIR